MLVSLHWLQQYITINRSAEQLAETLTMLGLEVENIEHQAEKYRGFVVGEVLEVRKHPKADKLSICSVNVGKENLQIVCGANNVAPEQKVAVGLAGAIVPRNQHDPHGEPFTLAQVKIRGVESFGMICSEYELGLGEDKQGILILGSHAKVGSLFSEYLGYDDTVLEIGITPNRPDAMSHIGVAREIGASTGKSLKIPRIKLKESNKKIDSALSVHIENKNDCPRYTARVVFGIKVEPSPDWIQQKLKAVGIRPVNNIVDITNYVLMEIGHPLHAFDYDKISGHRIHVRQAGKVNGFTTLDHKTRMLREDSLLICDGEGPVAIAGVMGGENTEITGESKNIIIESAYFNPQSIRRTSKHLGLSTDASQRFERGADPNITKWAVDRVASLIQEICGGEVLKGCIDPYPLKKSPLRIQVRVDKTNEVIGTTLTNKEINSLLKKLGILTNNITRKDKSRDVVECIVPTFRPDISREIDLIEEAVRAYGFNNIEPKVQTSLMMPENAPAPDFHDELRDFFVGSGFREVISNSMQGISIASLGSDRFVKIANPISKDMAALRTSLIPGMLEVVRKNIFHGTKDMRLFEIGKAYFNKSAISGKSLDNYVEEERLIICLSGQHSPASWSEKPRIVDIFDAKGEIQTLFHKIFLDKFKFIPYSTTNALTKVGLVIEINGESAGKVGLISPEILDRFEIEQNIVVGEIDISYLAQSKRKVSEYVPLPRYPVVLSDIAVVVDDLVPVEELEKEIWSSGKPLLRRLELFDVYTGTQLGEQKKSCAFALEFRSDERTLPQEEVDGVIRKVMQRLGEKFNAKLRA